MSRISLLLKRIFSFDLKLSEYRYIDRFSAFDSTQIAMNIFSYEFLLGTPTYLSLILDQKIIPVRPRMTSNDLFDPIVLDSISFLYGFSIFLVFFSFIELITLPHFNQVALTLT